HGRDLLPGAPHQHHGRLLRLLTRSLFGAGLRATVSKLPSSGFAPMSGAVAGRQREPTWHAHSSSFLILSALAGRPTRRVSATRAPTRSVISATSARRAKATARVCAPDR